MQISRRMIQRLTRSRGVTLNRRPAYLGRKVRVGDTISVRTREDERPTLQAVDLPLTVVYEDGDVLVADKPAGLLVHPTSEASPATLSHAVAHHFERQGLHAVVRPVHRLDRETSGLVLFARSSYAHQHLDRQLREGTLKREYLALVEGSLAARRGSIDAPIQKAGGPTARRRVSASGQPAITRYEVVEQLEGATLVRAELETGRTHQIRVHFSHIGHPLLGDALYGGRSLPGAARKRHALHAFQLSFAQPRSGEQVVCSSPLPSDLSELVEGLRKSGGGCG